MRIGLFASGNVGYEIGRYLGEIGEPPTCLVLDAKAPAAQSCRIRDASRVDESHVLLSDAVGSPDGVGALRAFDLDLAVLAWWPYILSGDLLRVPRLGCLNFHPSLLPHNRGKHYNFWALVEGAPFGVTIHFVDDGVDTGDIAFQAPLAVTWEDTGASLYERAQRAIVDLFIASYPTIRSGHIPRIPQDRSRGSFHRAAELEPASRIDLGASYTARELLNLLRARTFAPHPGAWFVDNGERYEVRVQITRTQAANG